MLPLLSAFSYDATSSLSQSDNLVRDTLVAAWKQLISGGTGAHAQRVATLFFYR